MSKTWDTKNKIVELLSAKRMTLTDLSAKLGLAPSTVNQHLKELMAANAIRQINNPFTMKWKYYEPNPDFNAREVKPMTMKTNVFANPWFKAVPAIAIIGMIAAVLLFTLGNAGGQSGISSSVDAQLPIGPGAVPRGATLFTISDAPGASTLTALNITVDSVYIHSTTTGKIYQVFGSSSNSNSMNGNGLNGSNSIGANAATETFDLVKLRNISQVIAGANLSAGSYDEIVLNVTNASAVINGTSTQVFLPSGKLKIFGKFNLSSNTVNWLNIDVNLAKSVHITGDGKVILLPVINLLAADGAKINVMTDNTIMIGSRGHVNFEGSFGMDENGNMGMGTEVPANATLAVGGHAGMRATIVVLSNQHASGQLTVHTHGGLVIITNVTTAANIIQNLTASNISIRVVGPGGNMHNEHIGCRYSDGQIACEGEGNVSIDAIASMMANSSASIFGNGSETAHAQGHGHFVINATVIGTGSGNDSTVEITPNSPLDVNVSIGSGMGVGNGDMGVGAGVGAHGGI